MKNYYELIREIRNRLEAPKLEFGCELEIWRELEEEPCGTVRFSDDIEIHDNKTLSVKSWKDTFAYKNLGKPVTIADILLLLNKRGMPSYFIRTDGVIFEWEKFTEGGAGFHGVKSLYIEPDLTKEICNQEVSVLQLIYSLIEQQ